MILLKTVWNNLKKNKIVNIFSIIQMILVFFLVCFMVSSAYIRYQYYQPFQDYFTENGIFYDYGPNFTFNDIDKMAITDMTQEEDLLRLVNDSTFILASYKAMIGSEDDKIFQNVVYDDQIIQRFQPELKNGRWLNITTNPNEVEAVVSENTYGWKVGDVVELKANNFPNNVAFNIKIVGILKDGAKIVGGGMTSVENGIDYNNFYYPYDATIEEYPIIILSKTALENIQTDVYIDPQVKDTIPMSISYSGIITTNEKLSEEDIEKITNNLNQYGSVSVVDLNDFNKSTLDYIWSQIKTLTPIVIVLVVMVFISSISISAISARVRLRDYVIYYINGLQWKYCIWINLMQSVVISGISTFITSLIILIIQGTAFKNSITITVNIYTIISILALIILYVLVSMIMPAIIIGKNTPKQILTR